MSKTDFANVCRTFVEGGANAAMALATRVGFDDLAKKIHLGHWSSGRYYAETFIAHDEGRQLFEIVDRRENFEQYIIRKGNEVEQLGNVSLEVAQMRLKLITMVPKTKRPVKTPSQIAAKKARRAAREQSVPGKKAA